MTIPVGDANRAMKYKQRNPKPIPKILKRAVLSFFIGESLLSVGYAYTVPENRPRCNGQ
jgi:hypothetical protein